MYLRCVGGASAPTQNDYIFKDGVLYTGITANGYRPSWSSNGEGSGSSYSIVDDKLVLTTGGSGASFSFFTDNIDLTDVQSISFTISASAHIGANTGIFIVPTMVDKYTIAAEIAGGVAVGTNSIDVSALSGNYRACVWGTFTNTTVTIDEIKLNR